jgi:hypothetical protein
MLCNPFAMMLFFFCLSALAKVLTFVNLSDESAVLLGFVIFSVIFPYGKCHRILETWMSLGGYGSRLMMGIVHIFASAWLVSFVYSGFLGRFYPGVRSLEGMLVAAVLTLALAAVAFQEYLRRLQGYLHTRGIALRHTPPAFLDWISPRWP